MRRSSGPQAAAVNGFLPRLRTVPERLWTVVMAVFAAVYILFFAVQSSYLFGAFSRTLPEDFTVAQYAREGFFELCRVMAINFSPSLPGEPQQRKAPEGG